MIGVYKVVSLTSQNTSLSTRIVTKVAVRTKKAFTLFAARAPLRFEIDEQTHHCFLFCLMKTKLIMECIACMYQK